MRESRAGIALFGASPDYAPRDLLNSFAHPVHKVL